MPKTINRVFEQFLAEQKHKLNKRNFSYCQDAVGLFEACLNSYGHLGLAEENNKLLDKSGLEFCEFFGPEILDYGQFSEYVGYFLPRKVMAGFHTADKYKKQILDLLEWLYEHKYCFRDEADIKAIKAELRSDFKHWWQECNKEYNDCDI